MSDTEGAKFVASHTMDISGNTVATVNGTVINTAIMNGTTLNTAIQRACGDNKGTFSLAIMHSVVATNLENLNLLEYMKYTDSQGIERRLAIGTLNGRTVLVDDTMPEIEVADKYELTSDSALVNGKTYYTRSGSGTTASPYTYTAVSSPNVSNIATYYEITDPKHNIYKTYVLGEGAIEYTNCGVKVPVEVGRDPAKNGGQDTLYSRQRKCFAPLGISFTMNTMATMSPTDAELELGANWEIVNSQTVSNKEYLNHKAIPIAQIISRG